MRRAVLTQHEFSNVLRVETKLSSAALNLFGHPVNESRRTRFGRRCALDMKIFSTLPQRKKTTLVRVFRDAEVSTSAIHFEPVERRGHLSGLVRTWDPGM
jgi:hypothetical protein